MRKILLSLIFIASFIPSRSIAQNVEQLADVMWHQTSYKEITAERRAAMNEMQKYADSFTHTLFNEYLGTTAGTRLQFARREGQAFPNSAPRLHGERRRQSLPGRALHFRGFHSDGELPRDRQRSCDGRGRRPRRRRPRRTSLPQVTAAREPCVATIT